MQEIQDRNAYGQMVHNMRAADPVGWNGMNYMEQRQLDLARAGDPHSLQQYSEKFGANFDFDNGQIAVVNGEIGYYKNNNEVYGTDNGGWGNEGYYADYEVAVIPATFVSLNSLRGNNASGVSDNSLARYIPVLGSGLDSYDAFARGDISRGVLHAALAISDIFLIKAAATAAIKVGVKGLAKATLKKLPKKFNPKNYEILKKPLKFRKVSFETGLGETTFQIGIRYKPTNAMIRLERHSANLIGGGRTYYTHFNTFPITKLNHFGLNPFKWGKIKY